ncbi:hypothetical protein [Nostoc sp.]
MPFLSSAELPVTPAVPFPTGHQGRTGSKLRAASPRVGLGVRSY